MTEVEEAALDVLFRRARSQNGWAPTPVSDDSLKAAYEIAKWGPTSMNTQPLRILFLRSAEAKARLKPTLSPGNVEKAMNAPVVALLAYDLRFHHHLPKTFPHNPNASAVFEGKDRLIDVTAFRNGTLQAAYFLLALRAVGLDAGPMSGFDSEMVDREFFSETSLRSNFICGIGHGDPAKVMPRLPRLTFDDVATSL